MDVALGLDLRQRGPQSSPELPQSSPRCPPELPQKSFATAGCQACAPCYRWLSPRAPQSSPRAPLLPLAARHVLPATAGCEAHLESSPLPETPWRHAQSCKSVPRRSRETENRPRTEARRYPKVLYCMRRTLIFESRLRKIENEVSKSAVLCSQYSHFREQAPHCLKVRC